MKPLDRYVLKEFISPLLLVVFGIAALILLVEFVDTLPRLREDSAPFSLIAAYHLARFPFLVAQALPMGVMLASILALGALARTSELTAARAGGVSSARLALPILIAALGLSLLLLAASELFIPRASEYARYVQRVLIEKKDLHYDRHWRNNMAKTLSGGRQLFTEEFDASSAFMRQVVLVRRKEGRIASRTDAERMNWAPDSGWTLIQGVERTFDDEGGELTMRSFRQWPADIKEEPKDFMVDADKREQDLVQLSIKELSDIIVVLKKTGADYRKELICLHLRISYPFSCFILALLGVSLPFLFPSGRRAMAGAALGLLVSLGVGMLYLTFIQVGLSLGKNGSLPIIPAAWIANVAFLFVGGTALWRANR